MKKLKTVLAVLLVSTVAANAQTSIVAAGGEASTLSYTIGQPFYEAASSDTGSLTSGVQQAYVITAVEVGVPELAAAIELSANVYPNPVADRLALSVTDTDAALRYTITDSSGRTLATAEIADVLTEIDMANLVPAVYFLRVDDRTAVVKTFKIIKN